MYMSIFSQQILKKIVLTKAPSIISNADKKIQLSALSLYFIWRYKGSLEDFDLS